VIDEREMPRDTYTNHPELMQSMKTDYLHRIHDRNINRIYLVADVTGNYGLISLFEVKNMMIDCKIHYTAGKMPRLEKNGIWLTPKELLVDTLKDVMESGAIRVADYLEQTIDEMNYFQMTQ